MWNVINLLIGTKSWPVRRLLWVMQWVFPFLTSVFLQYAIGSHLRKSCTEAVWNKYCSGNCLKMFLDVMHHVCKCSKQLGIFCTSETAILQILVFGIEHWRPWVQLSVEIHISMFLSSFHFLPFSFWGGRAFESKQDFLLRINCGYEKTVIIRFKVMFTYWMPRLAKTCFWASLLLLLWTGWDTVTFISIGVF